MINRAPSLPACFFLLPCSYVCEGSLHNVRKAIARGRPYFYRLLAARREVGKACAGLPHWKRTTVLSCFFAACYLHRHGLYGGLANMVAKLRKFGLRGILFAALAEIHKLSMQRSDESQNFLLCFDKNAYVGKGLLSFVHCLKSAACNVEIFVEQNVFLTKVLRHCEKWAFVARLPEAATHL